MRQSRKRTVLYLAALLTPILSFQEAFAREAMVMYSLDFPAGEAQLICNSWYNHRSAAGGWSGTGRYVTMTHLIADVDKDQMGADTSYADNADALFVCAHGDTRSGDILYISELPVPFISNAVSMADHVELGDSDLDTIHVYSCGGAQWIDRDGNGVMSRADYPFRGWWRDGGAAGIGSIHGMHGIAWSSAFWFFGWHVTFPNAGSISSRGEEQSIARAWFGETYARDFQNGDDNCPISFAFGASSTEATRNLHRQYDDTAFETNPTGSNWVAWWRAVGCDPRNGPPLP
jgi:hypothetical protein